MEDDYITPAQLCELVPGMTESRLSQMRFKGTSGLKYYKPTPKTVLYRRSEVLSWVESSARFGTAETA